MIITCQKLDKSSFLFRESITKNVWLLNCNHDERLLIMKVLHRLSGQSLPVACGRQTFCITVSSFPQLPFSQKVMQC